MVAGTCPHCNQKIDFTSPTPGIYECPYCSEKFKIGTTNSKSTPKKYKPKKPIQQPKRNLYQNIALGLSISIGSICMIICISILFSGDDDMLVFSFLPFFLGSYLLVYSYKITSKSGGSKSAIGNQTATLLRGGEEITVQLQSNNNGTAIDGVLKVLGVGVLVSLVLTIIGLVVMAIILYIFLMMIFGSL